MVLYLDPKASATDSDKQGHTSFSLPMGLEEEFASDAGYASFEPVSK